MSAITINNGAKINLRQGSNVAINVAGGGGTGDGDMMQSIYDPQLIEADAFDRLNHTGTQLASTISDFDIEVSNNTDVLANTASRHDAATGIKQL